MPQRGLLLLVMKLRFYILVQKHHPKKWSFLVVVRVHTSMSTSEQVQKGRHPSIALLSKLIPLHD